MRTFIVCREIISSDKELQLIAKEFVEKYLSVEKAVEFKNAYNMSDFKKADEILLNALEHVNDKGLKEYSNIIKLNLTSELARRRKMEVLFIILAAVLVAGGIGVYCYLKQRANKAYTSASNKVRQSNSHKYQYNQQDKDLLLLVKELSEVYQKTDEYLNC